MSFLRGSANYVWCTTSVLGKGATGAVYQGVNKVNGEPVAVKTFNQLSHMRPPDVQMREFEVLRKVKHENIVKLLAIEEEQPDTQRSSGKVIVMELCTGGSLFNILDDPENTYGLQEVEFLWVLEHLSAGMKHLRDNNLVHRDLKPGNIMKFIREDGTTVYKLTDFGAARELQEDQQFMSLYGTEEYLHPDMYERAVLRKPVGKTFGATVDLWSIGVTLYHVATGNLPFRPFGGRRNKETMFYITTKKASGVISGLQTKDNGPIEWSKELPNNCQLSTGLKKIVTPLLAGLLEVDPQRIWNFDRFFTEVTNTLSRKPLHIFHVNNASSIKVFVSPDDTYEQIQQYIMEQTSIHPDSQILLHENGPLLGVIDENTRGCGYPSTKEEQPLMLFSKENNNIVLPAEAEIPKFPEFPNLVSVENDAAQAKLSCSIGHVCKRRIEKVTSAYILINDAVAQLTNYETDLLRELHRRCVHLTDITANKKQTVSSIQLAQNTTNVLLSLLKQSFNMPDLNWILNLNEIGDLFSLETLPKVQQLHQRNVVDNSLRLEWQSVTRPVSSPAGGKCPRRARTQVERLRDSWQHLLRDRATRSLSYNDEQFHVLERIKISETGRRLKALLEVDCVPAFTQLAELLGDWYKIAQTTFLQTQILQKDVDLYEENLEKFSECLRRETSNYEDELKVVLKQVTAGATSSKKAVIYSEQTKLKQSLCEAVRHTDEIAKAVREGTVLIEQFCDLAVYKCNVLENGESEVGYLQNSK